MVLFQVLFIPRPRAAVRTEGTGYQHRAMLEVVALNGRAPVVVNGTGHLQIRSPTRPHLFVLPSQPLAYGHGPSAQHDRLGGAE